MAGEIMRLDVKHGLDQMLDGLDALEPRNIPFATAMALTKTAKHVEQQTRTNMASDIDRPTPFTLRSLYTKPASKTDLTATVRFKDFAGKGTPAGKYLQPITEGKARGDKSSERKLKNSGNIPIDKYLAPAKGSRTNAYGNVTASRYVQILSYLKSSGESGFTANRSDTSTKRNKKMRQFFTITEKGQGTGLARSLPPGIYERLAGTAGKAGKAVRMVFALVRQPRYRVSFPFYSDAQELAVKRFPIEIQAAIEFIAKQAHAKRR